MTQEITRQDLLDLEKDIANDVDTRFKAMEQAQQIRYDKVDQRYEELLTLLKPIAEMYSHTTTFGRWVVAGLTFLTLLFGFLATASDGFKAFKVFVFKIFT